MRRPAFFAYADNYLIDVKFGIIVDVETSRAIRQAEVGAAKMMIERAEKRFDLKPDYGAADTAYGSAETLDWVVNEKRIAPNIPVVDKSGRVDGSLNSCQPSRSRSQRKCAPAFCSTRAITSCSTAAVWQDYRSLKVPSRSTVTVPIVVEVIRSKAYIAPQL